MVRHGCGSLVLLVVVALAAATLQAHAERKPQEDFHGDSVDDSRISKKSKKCEPNGGECMSRKECNDKVFQDYKCPKKQVCCLEDSVSDCPVEEGFFYQYSSSQCFLYLNDAAYNFDQANEACSNLGLVLARPYDAVGLRSYMVQRFRNSFCWIGAQGNGTVFKWLNDGAPLTNENPLWYPEHPGAGVSPTYCLRFLAHDREWLNQPDKPYATQGCLDGNTNWFQMSALCEKL